MGKFEQLPPHVVQMVRRDPPAGVPVVEGSTPVVAFGDPGVAEVATLGINPSWREFLGDDGELLRGDDRRLTTTTSLGVDRLDRLSNDDVVAVVDGCYGYFTRNPYWKWFRPLDCLLKTATDSSYSDGTACHLDLAQWATKPTWGDLDTTSQQELITKERLSCVPN